MRKLNTRIAISGDRGRRLRSCIPANARHGRQNPTVVDGQILPSLRSMLIPICTATPGEDRIKYKARRKRKGEENFVPLTEQVHPTIDNIHSKEGTEFDAGDRAFRVENKAFKSIPLEVE